jgi:hypothetical protein
MKAKNSQARKNLFRKLLALRVTLPNDEQVILDSIMAEEVQGHTMNFSKVSSKAASKAASKASAKAAEANAHSMTSAKALKKATAKASKKATAKAV